jgi:hypothetical protein
MNKIICLKKRDLNFAFYQRWNRPYSNQKVWVKPTPLRRVAVGRGAVNRRFLFGSPRST